ncbi:MAG: aminotransferase class III-fold pyridoxal phosphate-dependent enzyme [Clostridia bacterium]|nr:aminotransferase class III-fold pyridoxal phosphate-dependent enzyme [Clostridia bacterium]
MYTSPKLSLEDILGNGYTDALVAANAALGMLGKKEAHRLAAEKIDFFPAEKQQKNDELLASVGKEIIPHFYNDNDGAATAAFAKALSKDSAPVTGVGCFRLGEDGKLYLIGKSEHYHAPLGHRFDGYRLIDNARALGVLNATHNNTRGYITRLCERRLVQSANGIDWSDDAATEKIISSTAHKVLNRVINLETGSLSVEAGIKMMLARFYRLSPEFPEPKYYGKTPVFFVMADNHGGREANYHGTTVVAQTFRGLWPEFAEKEENAGIYKVIPVSINDIDDFKAKIEKYNSGEYKTAGFLHEIVLMNYGGIKLTKEFLNEAYALCEKFDTPTLVDEIQSCMWYRGFFQFRLYDLKPDFVIIGKGFPGGEYPASKIICTAEYDTLNQFGALVTNGQEELASLAYLITMNYMRTVGAEVEKTGEMFEAGLKAIAARHPRTIVKAEGMQLLAALHFADAAKAAEFAKEMKKHYIDASAQTYKPHCPPALLLKPPVISSEATVEFILRTIETIIEEKEA